jgi:hypothetical protein
MFILKVILLLHLAGCVRPQSTRTCKISDPEYTCPSPSTCTPTGKSNFAANNHNPYLTLFRASTNIPTTRRCMHCARPIWFQFNLHSPAVQAGRAYTTALLRRRLGTCRVLPIMSARGPWSAVSQNLNIAILVLYAQVCALRTSSMMGKESQRERMSRAFGNWGKGFKMAACKQTDTDWRIRFHDISRKLKALLI